MQRALKPYSSEYPSQVRVITWDLDISVGSCRPIHGQKAGSSAPLRSAMAVPTGTGRFAVTASVQVPTRQLYPTTCFPYLPWR